MLPGFSQSPDWLSSEPFMFEDVQSLMELDFLPTPPQSPPTKPLSKEEQLSYVSDVLLEDADLQLLSWTSDLFAAAAEEGSDAAPDEADEDSLWQGLEEKLVASALGCSPLLSAIDTSIFEDMVASTLNCQDLLDAAASDCDETSASSPSSSMSSSSDSEEEIDVVSLGASTPPPARRSNPEEEQRAIQLQHNYAAPRPASPPPVSRKRSRASDGTPRLHHAARSSAPSSHHHCPSLSPVETEDEEERRRTHNVMERQRRNELKNCFLRLRDNVPELSHNDKASKVVILRKARDCVHGLEAESLRLRARRDKLMARQEELKARLEQLR